MKSPVASVCSLSGDALSERVSQWTHLRKRALKSASRVDGGAAFTYKSSPEVEAELEQLVVAERDCCAVGGIGWSLEKAADMLTLHVTMPEALRDSKEAKLIFNVIGGA